MTCEHPIIDITDLNTFDGKCRMCGKIVTKHGLVKKMKKRLKRKAISKVKIPTSPS